MEKINIFCIPFAGGSKYSYRGFEKNAPSNINIIPIELPGRGGRFRETLLTDSGLIADDIFRQIEGQLNKPYAIYGHSMGTLMAYLLTKKIIENNLPQPLHLFLTGGKGPSVDFDESPRYLLSKKKFLEKLKELGGMPDEILQDNDLMDFFEPILRADFEAIETHQYKEASPFSIPMTVIIGIQEKTTYDEALEWQKETTEKIELRQFPGKHFFIFDYEKEITELISKKVHKKNKSNEKSTCLS